MSGAENLKRILDQICRDKGIDRSLLVDAIEEAVRSAVRKKFGGRRDIEVQFNEVMDEGFERIELNLGAEASSGMYFYRLEAVGLESGERFVQSRKMLLMR